MNKGGAIVDTKKLKFINNITLRTLQARRVMNASILGANTIHFDLVKVSNIARAEDEEYIVGIIGCCWIESKRCQIIKIMLTSSRTRSVQPMISISSTALKTMSCAQK